MLIEPTNFYGENRIHYEIRRAVGDRFKNHNFAVTTDLSLKISDEFEIPVNPSRIAVKQGVFATR